MDSDHSIPNNYVKKLIGDLVPGDIVLNPLYRTDGLLLVDKNKKLNETLINIIKKHVAAATSVLVAVPGSDEDAPYDQQNNTQFQADYHQLIHEYINNSEKIQEVSSHLNGESAEHPVVHALITCPYWHNFENNYESDRLKQRAVQIKDKLINLVKDNEFYLTFYQKMKDYDDVLLIYSLNACSISLMIGLTLELSDNDLLDLATAALCSNIGYTELPRSDFKGIMRSQQYSSPAMRKHIEIFSEITSSSPYLRKKIILGGILDHHEYYNGKGYPYGKKGDAISLFGRILHIALAYDSLVGSYNHTPGLIPYEAFSTIYENAESKYDPYILGIFIHRTTYFKLGSTLQFENGIHGEIIGFDNYLTSPHRPIVRKENGTIRNLLTL